LARLAGFAVFTFLDCFILADFICYRAATCTHGAPDECAFTSAGEATYDSTAYSGAADNLRSSVFLMIAGGLFADGPVVLFLPGLGLLGKRRQRKGDDGAKSYKRCASSEVHWILLVHLFRMLGRCSTAEREISARRQMVASIEIKFESIEAKFSPIFEWAG
jgi:hypothetical protein